MKIPEGEGAEKGTEENLKHQWLTIILNCITLSPNVRH